jgi:hypothetical protein
MDNIDLSEFITVKCNGIIFDNYLINPITTQIVNQKTKKLLNPSKNVFGYYHTGFYIKRKLFPIKVHRVVFESVHGDISKGYVIDHIDNDKTNNSIDNLQMITQRENTLKSVAYRPKRILSPKPVKATNLITGEIQHFKSQNYAGQVLGVHPMCISMICNGVTKSSTSKKNDIKYTFEYVTSQLEQSPSVP